MTDHKPITDEELREIRERCEKASKGPWGYEDQSEELSDLYDAPWAMRPGLCVPTGIKLVHPHGEAEGYYLSRRDAAFIAHARTDVPRLLDEVERLKSQTKSDCEAIHTSDREQVTRFKTQRDELARLVLEAQDYCLEHEKHGIDTRECPVDLARKILGGSGE